MVDLYCPFCKAEIEYIIKMDLEKCNKCHWKYNKCKNPWICNICICEYGQTGFKELKKDVL